MIDGMTPFEKAQLSAAWLAQFEASTAADHWVHGFRLLHRSSGNIVGFCSFKGPPTDGVVEIAYGIAPEEQGKGYATEAARALVEFARTFPEVRVIRAHTLPDGAALDEGGAVSALDRHVPSVACDAFRPILETRRLERRVSRPAF